MRAIRVRVGDKLAAWCKIDSVEYERPGGITIEDDAVRARMLEAAGADAITVT